MTENQENELFDTLANLAHGVNGIKSDVREIKIVLDKHSHILGEHTRILDEHTQILGEHSLTLHENSATLNTLVAKVDSIADTVMTNDKRLTAVEKGVDDLRDQVH